MSCYTDAVAMIHTYLVELLARSQDHLRFMDSRAWSPRRYFFVCYSVVLLLVLFLVAVEIFGQGSLTLDQQMLPCVMALGTLPIIGFIYCAPLAIIFRACRLLLSLLDPQRSKACLNPDLRPGEILDSVSIWVGRQTFRLLGLPVFVLMLSFSWVIDPFSCLAMGVFAPFGVALVLAVVSYPAQSLVLTGALILTGKKLTLEFLWRAQATISPWLLAWYIHHNFDLPDLGLVLGFLLVAFLYSSRYLAKYCLAVLTSDSRSKS